MYAVKCLSQSWWFLEWIELAILLITLAHTMRRAVFVNVKLMLPREDW